jgi:acyl-CoA synthetase (AMP-forming)/AMP-acid ligase II
MRTTLYRDPTGIFLHDAVLESCRRFGEREAVIDTGGDAGANARLTYARLGELIEAAARGFVREGLRPGEVVAIFLANSWEYVVAAHAITLAGGIPTLLNPSYKEREARYQLENSGAAMLISDAAQLSSVSRQGLPLRQVHCTRHEVAGAIPFSQLLKGGDAAIPAPMHGPKETLAALPYSSGTTGLPKGVMLSHHNLVANAYQYLAPGEASTARADDRFLCFLPLYHIYGLNVVLNPTLLVGATVVLMPRFDVDHVLRLIAEEQITYLPQVPPVMNALCAVAEQGRFPQRHRIRGTKSGAAPLAPELAKRFDQLTGIPVRQGYGMTEASPVTHIGFFERELYRPDSIGRSVALTDCRIVREDGSDCGTGEAGELVMRGPQFMRGYWKAPEATESVLRDGWYWSGDVAVRDEQGFYKIVDRRKEMIKYKGFPIAPAEVEAVLLEHPAVRDCGVVGKADDAAGEVPIAFIVARDQQSCCAKLADQLCGYVGDRLSHYKQPKEVRFVNAIPRNPSGKILRKDLRSQL